MYIFRVIKSDSGETNGCHNVAGIKSALLTGFYPEDGWGIYFITILTIKQNKLKSV